MTIPALSQLKDQDVLPLDLSRFFIEFQDHLAPRLDTYEQVLYLYVFRHSRLIGESEVVIGFKSARTRMACGVGQKGTVISEGCIYEKLQSLKEKRCIEIVSSERAGRRLRLFLPSEIAGVIPPPPAVPSEVDIEQIDYFSEPENRQLILKRDGHRCFYCDRVISTESHVIEHVVSRPKGGNNYRNVVAGCRECNNRKKDWDADEFLRILYREGFLGAEEFKDRLSRLERLRNGELRPELPKFVTLAGRPDGRPSQ